MVHGDCIISANYGCKFPYSDSDANKLSHNDVFAQFIPQVVISATYLNGTSKSEGLVSLSYRFIQVEACLVNFNSEILWKSLLAFLTCSVR